MKLLKKVVAMAVLAVLMAMVIQVETNAEQLNVTESLVWGKGYNLEVPRTYGESHSYKYTMHLQQSGKVSFAVNNDSTGMELYIYNLSSEAVYGSRYSYIGDGFNSYSIELLAGDYTVEFRKEKHSYAGTTSFVASFVPSGETVTENYMYKNNQVGTASSYAIGTTVKAHFAKNDDTDIYVMNVNKSGYLTMKYSSNVTKFHMKLVNANGDVTYEQKDIPLGASNYKYFVPKGTYYISFVRGGNDYTGTYTFSSKFSGMTVTKVKTVKNLKGKKAKLTWSKKSDVNGYQVQVAQNKKFTKGKKSKVVAVSSYSHPKSYTFTKLKKGKTYYARVRTFKLVNGQRYYSDWSAAKKFKVNK
ncbi:MAG: fibronectin type III domain-containing protein [Lachnospiraceae bacterium]|nr:fibronectin type III domain-containing protein [Lachnospiraceae bacterium]